MKCAWRVNAVAKLQTPILLQTAYNGPCAKYAIDQCLLLVEGQLCGYVSLSFPQFLMPQSRVQNYNYVSHLSKLYIYLCPVYWDTRFDANYCIICSIIYSIIWLVTYLRVCHWIGSRRLYQKVYVNKQDINKWTIDGRYTYNYTNYMTVKHKDVANPVILLVCERATVN
jgi:hypothetical protein